MKTQKVLAVLATASLLTLVTGCNSGGKSDRYNEGFEAGKKEGYEIGYDDGHADGDAAGYARAEAYFKTADYMAGFEDGELFGLAEGYAQGYNVGKLDGQAESVQAAYDLGYYDGRQDGEEYGLEVGFELGFADGEEYGLEVGLDQGFIDGESYGFEIGFDEGWLAAEEFYGLSIGKTKKLQGYADVLSAFHNDLIDYSKIKAPVQTKRGLVANGRLLLSETSQTNKDTLKRVAAVEQYLVVEMSKQIKGKFGLSAERSLKVAKAANHFRKYSSKRALTAEDTNAYASEIVGVDFKTIEKAYDSSMKGDLSELTSILEKAAEKNETSPEKMGEVIAELFI